MEHLSEHSVTVQRLSEMLKTLKEDDVLVPNQVRNLAIYRNDQYIGFIDLLNEGKAEPRIELFDEMIDV